MKSQWELAASLRQDMHRCEVVADVFIDVIYHLLKVAVGLSATRSPVGAPTMPLEVQR